MFIYGDAMISGPDYRELSDMEIKYGLLDCHGEVSYFTVRQKIINSDDVHWVLDTDDWVKELDDKKWKN